MEKSSKKEILFLVVYVAFKAIFWYNKVLLIFSERGGLSVNFPADIWPKVLSLMEGDMTATTINTWFDDATPVALDANRFVLHTPYWTRVSL